MGKDRSFIITARDIIQLVAVLAIVGSAVAYAHTTFAYRDEVVEIRSMILDLWKHQGLDKAKKK